MRTQRNVVKQKHRSPETRHIQCSGEAPAPPDPPIGNRVCRLQWMGEPPATARQVEFATVVNDIFDRTDQFRFVCSLMQAEIPIVHCVGLLRMVKPMVFRSGKLRKVLLCQCSDICHLTQQEPHSSSPQKQPPQQEPQQQQLPLQPPQQLVQTVIRLRNCAAMGTLWAA